MNLKGIDVIIRPVAPSDKSRFLDGIQQLSANTLFLRFLSPIRQLSNSQVDYLINCDFEDHFAVAVVLDQPSYPGMAVTRYIRSYENPEEAEWAVTVIDKYQGLGLGRILLYLMNLVCISVNCHVDCLRTRDPRFHCDHPSFESSCFVMDGGTQGILLANRRRVHA